MKYGNEPSLPMRLKEIIEKFRIIADSFIKDRAIFIKSVANTRNYFTHYDYDLKEKAANEEQLYHLTQKLKILLEIILLSELEFNLTEIQHSIVRNIYYLAEVDEKQKA